MSEEAKNVDLIELAKAAVAFERPIALYFPWPAEQIGELGRRVLLDKGVRYWISPGGDSLTCVACGLTSHNPHDVSEHYCGACHRFLDDPKQGGTMPEENSNIQVEITDASELHCFRPGPQPGSGGQIEIMLHARSLVDLIHKCSLALCDWQAQTTGDLLRALGHPEFIAPARGIGQL